MAEIFLAELEAFITAGNESVIEERPSCENEEENHIRYDVIRSDHWVDSRVFGVKLIFGGNWAGSGNKTGLAEEVSAEGEVSNKPQVDSLIDKSMQLWTIVDWSLIYFKH